MKLPHTLAAIGIVRFLHFICLTDLNIFYHCFPIWFPSSFRYKLFFPWTFNNHLLAKSQRLYFSSSFCSTSIAFGILVTTKLKLCSPFAYIDSILGEKRHRIRCPLRDSDVNLVDNLGKAPFK